MRSGPPSRVMVDLSVAGDGYSGIPQDSRLIFSMLSAAKRFSVSGLMYPLGKSVPLRMREGAWDSDARLAAGLHVMSQGWSPPPMRHPLQWLTSNAKQLVTSGLGAAKPRQRLHKIPQWLKTDALWRMLFQKTLPSTEKDRILASDFFYANVSVAQLYGRTTYLPFLKPVRLDTTDCDALLLPLPRPFSVPKGVAKIVRYHDAIPLTHPDTVTNWHAILWHHRFTNQCAKDSLFVCNSPMSRDDVDNVAPGAGEKAVVVPCAIQPAFALRQRPSVHDILVRRMSLCSVTNEESLSAAIPDLRQIERTLRANAHVRYIICVSTLDPRKNYVGLIAAWERLRVATKQDIKLVIVANRGCGMERAVESMRPHVLAGDLIHVQNVPAAELQVLYENAEMCAFVPFSEGFGFCPLEAMRVGVPVVASDLPIFRWTLGDSALFADPYNVGEIAEGMRLLMNEPQNSERRSLLMQKAAAAVDRFSVANVSEQWCGFFSEEMPRLLSKSRSKKADRHHYPVPTRPLPEPVPVHAAAAARSTAPLGEIPALQTEATSLTTAIH